MAQLGLAQNWARWRRLRLLSTIAPTATSPAVPGWGVLVMVMTGLNHSPGMPLC